MLIIGIDNEMVIYSQLGYFYYNNGEKSKKPDQEHRIIVRQLAQNMKLAKIETFGATKRAHTIN